MGTSIQSSPSLTEGARRLRAALVTDGVDRGVVDAMMRVPREEFVPEASRELAYEDAPLAIGLGQTISQPTLVGKMTDALRLHRRSRVLEVGTGCGYQTAILAELASDVWSIELEPALSQAAAARLRRLGYRNIETRVGDGYFGWPEHAPFDAIIVTAAAPHVPPALVDQLARRGRMILPVESELFLVTKDANGGVAKKMLAHVSFVPLRGAAR